MTEKKEFQSTWMSETERVSEIKTKRSTLATVFECGIAKPRQFDTFSRQNDIGIDSSVLPHAKRSYLFTVYLVIKFH